jgi:hypothetical protein
MPDDNTKIGNADTPEVSGSDERDRGPMSRRPGATVERVVKAIRKVGTSRRKVEAELRKR